ncbi:MAG: PASTA domain-containing protein [Oscillospiraceae bacterium]|nr:PASTA domain-containing protein [Oscillospiraceae bacterium]
MAEDYRPSSSLKRRYIVVGVLAVAAITYAIGCLYKTAILEHEKYSAMASENQFGSTTVKAARGTIYDTNGKILAQSSAVYNIILAPGIINGNASLDNSERDRQARCAAKILVEEIPDFGYTEDEIVKMFYAEDTAGRQWIKLASKIDRPVVDKIMERAKADELSGNLIYTEQESKRFYPQGSLAANVIGFTNYEGDGIYGVEASYNDYLAGIDGKVISAKDGRGNEMPYNESEVYQSKDGDSIYLTIDSTLQYYLEKELNACVEQNNVQERASAIIMDAKTGAVLAMAVSPGFDLNDRSSIYSAKDRAALAAYAEENPGDTEGYSELYAKFREQQWKNKAISEPYEPGSVFKVVTGSSALEEEAITLDSTFYCGGAIQVADWEMHCWTSGDHGTQDFTRAMTNSCNPAFIQIGQRLGIEKFLQYYRAYGFTELTGIDLPGEALGLSYDEDSMGIVELASASFGQSNTVTPIQMITAYTAVINGGYLLKPYVVEKVVDPNGNVVMTQGKTVRRQVISEEVSAEMRQVLEDVVNNNGGGNVYIKGYRIGGKSGTGQKLIKSRQTGDWDLYVSSYVAFAPANDPDIIMLCMVDEPKGYRNGSLVYYGSLVAAPVVSAVFKEALPYLGYYPEYTESELAVLDVAVPDVKGMTVEEAQETLEGEEFSYTVKGSGVKVVSQNPSGKAPAGAKIVLYTEEDYEEQMVTVPNVIGYYPSDARYLLEQAGLNYRAGDGASENSTSTAYAQSYEAGSEIPAGTVVEVTFISRTEG